jgi:GNAT superfamily N-acetyltransferase
MRLRMRPLAGADPATVDAWIALRTRAAEHDRPAGPPVCPAELRGSLLVPPPATEMLEWAAFAGDDLVGTVRLELPAEENTDLAVAETLVVDPAWRGRGVGTALLEQAAGHARARGRHRLAGTTVAARPAADPAADPAAGWARRRGAEPVYRMVHNQLRLGAGAEGLPGWQPDSSRFEILTWGTVVPDDLVADVAELQAVLSGDGQSGDDRWQPHAAEVRRVRELERMRLSRGRRAHQLGLRDRTTGQLVARGVLSVTRSWPDVGLLAGAVVLPAYRGRGLGGILALEGLRRAAALQPRLRLVDTWNVHANHRIRHIIAGLGFTEVADWTTWNLAI